MNRLLQTALCIALAGFLPGCLTPRNVSFHETAAALKADGLFSDMPAPERFYLDMHGALYPREGMPEWTRPPTNWDGDLFGQFVRSESALCSGPSTDGDIATMCRSLQGDGANAVADLFAAQEAIWKQRGEALARTALDRAGGGDPEIVVVIHGFNNRLEDAAPIMARARQLAAAASPNPAALTFAEVYWDGCWNVVGPRCWGRGQRRGPLVGFSLRQLLNAVDESVTRAGKTTRMRVITHSSGAFVMGAALGYPEGVLKALTDGSDWYYERFARLHQKGAPPHRVPQIADMRLAMFAPATPAQTFTGFEIDGRGLLAHGVRLSYTVQPDDATLGKKRGFAELGCASLGVTCLGVSREVTCDLIYPSDHLDRLDTVIAPYDFTRDGTGVPKTEHGFQFYLDQAAAQSVSILPDLMTREEAKNRTLVTC